MGGFRRYLQESSRKVGKTMGRSTYVHKDYVGQSDVPKDAHDKALKVLHKVHPGFDYTVVKHNAETGAISFLYSPDWDTAHEPHIHDSMTVSANGAAKYNKPKFDPQIYHQKWAFVGDDYKGFDVERSKRRTQQYRAAVEKVKAITGDSTVSSKIGTKSYWESNVVPHILTETIDNYIANLRPVTGTELEARNKFWDGEENAPKQEVHNPLYHPDADKVWGEDEGHYYIPPKRRPVGEPVEMATASLISPQKYIDLGYLQAPPQESLNKPITVVRTLGGQHIIQDGNHRAALAHGTTGKILANIYQVSR